MRFCTNIFLTLLASFLFSLAHPNFLFENGVAFFGFIALFPLYIVLKRATLKNAWLFGAIFGGISYGLFCYWLTAYHPYTIYIAVFSYALILALLFEILEFEFLLFEKIGCKSDFFSILLLSLTWTSYEFLKTKGFLGFSYGILAYSQWKSNLFLQSASWGGVWPLSFFCAFTSFSFGNFVFTKKPILFVKKNHFLLTFWAFCFLFLLVSGKILLLKYSNQSSQTVSVICAQNNTDSHKYDFEIYKRDISILKSLSKKGLEAHPNADLVVWPETAVVPPIIENYNSKRDFDRYQMVLDILRFFSENDSAFVVGNQHTEKDGDFNSALVFDSYGKNPFPPEPKRYSKIHLVPFSEYFPYKKQFPRIYKKLLNGDVCLWEPGTERVVFDVRNLHFSVPICFEDTFGSDCRLFAKRGAEFFVNISNDSWSKSAVCQKQHLSMAVFRSVENRIPSVRCTASGETCAIDSCGKITAYIPNFSENFLYAELHIVPKNKENFTFYTKYGDYFAYICIFCAGILIIFRGFLYKIFDSKIFQKIGEHLKKNT